jgi:UDP-N-acetylglucosamine transferase subunit ALG13
VDVTARAHVREAVDAHLDALVEFEIAIARISFPDNPMVDPERHRKRLEKALGQPGEGTFVAVGTRREPFDRLLRIVDDAVGAGLLPGPVTAQSGHSAYAPRHYDTVAWLTPEHVEEAARRARYVVCHSGSGIIGAALRNGHRPLVLPRLRCNGEHVDDHQLQIAQKLEAMGLAVALDGPIEDADVRAAAAPLPDAARDAGAPSVADALRAAVARDRIAA